MLNFSFGSALEGTLTIGGIFLLTTGFLLSTGVLSAGNARVGGITPQTHGRWLVLSLLPWLLVLSTARGVQGLSPLGTLGGLGLRTQLGLGLIFLLLFVLIVYHWRGGLNWRWAFESCGALLVLHLCWLFVWSASSLLFLILWVELASLVVLLLLCFLTLGQPDLTGITAGWTETNFTRQAQLGFLQALLAFLWASGLAALLLLWGFALSLGQFGGLEYWQLALLSTSTTAGFSSWASYLVTLSLFIGVFLKLLLQPFQFFLLLFYKQLPLSNVASYLGFYYGFLVPVLVSQACSFFFFLSAPSALIAALVCCFSLAAIAAGLGSVTELRAALAFSTMFNLCLLLLVVAGL